MLNPMVQSDLVTYRGGTIVILFLQATNSLTLIVLHNIGQVKRARGKLVV